MFTEDEVRELLRIQRENCWVALYSVTKDKNLLDKVLNAPEPGSFNP